MYPHVTQFETTRARALDLARLDRERRAASRRRSANGPAPSPRTGVRSVLAALLRAS